VPWPIDGIVPDGFAMAGAAIALRGRRRDDDVPAPTDADVARLVAAIARRIGRVLAVI